MFTLFKRRLYAYLAIYLLIMGVVTLVLASRHQTLTGNYISASVREFDQRIESYRTMQQKMIDNYQQMFLSSPRIGRIMERSADADAAEQALLRRELLELSAKPFDTLQEYDVRLLFFHLPGAVGFLRVHEPDKFGDSLAKSRPLIVHAQETKQKISAFETGKLFDGFRTVYPLFRDRKFVGTVEIAYTFSALKEQAIHQKRGAYTFLIKRDIQETKAKQSDLKRHYVPSLFGDEYLEDRKDTLLIGAEGFDKGEIAALIGSNGDLIRKALARGTLQGIKLYHEGKYSLLILKPVYEFNGNQAAYMVELTGNHAFFEDRIREFILLWLGIAVLSALLMWYVFRYHRSTVFLEQYRDAIEKTMIVSRTDPRGIITYVNDRFAEVSGYRESELMNRSHNIIRHPDTPSALFKELWQTIKAGKIWKGEIKNRTKAGEAYYVKSTIYPLVDENGQIVEYIGLREDVTELVEAAKKLEDEKRRFDTIFQHQKSIVVFTGKEGGIEMVNRRFFDYFDFPDLNAFLAQHQCVCEMFLERKGYISAPSFEEFFERLAESSEEFRKVLVRDKRGEERILAVEFAAISLTEKEYIIFSYHDITELDETLQREEQLRFQAQRSEAAKMEFLANMSHEIRTPLNGIMGFAKLLENAPLAEEHHRQARIISEQSKTLLGIINDILDLSKIESGHLELEKVLINPFVEFEMAFSLFAPVAQEKGIDYSVALDSRISECIGLDSLRIKQV
ncbi:MAG: histidine kinase dimerization/phospho-acceptor domain-containing protein, partial [Campylobacterota bacterium]